jgi:hypothetical protein
VGSSEREAGGLEDLSDGINREPQPLERVSSKEGQAVVSAEEDQREGREVTVADFDPRCRLFPFCAVSHDHGNPSIRSDPKAGQERGRELAEGGSGVHETFDGNRRLIAGPGWTDMDLN